ncbi:hypothetical protein EMCRGX_G014466 [Ephydatia muelleri]
MGCVELLVVVLGLFCLTNALGPLGQQATHGLDIALSRYERLQTSHLWHTVIRKGMPRPEDNQRQLDFSALGRDFRLYLSPNRKIFHSHFKAVTVDGNNTEAPINVDLNEYYHGRVYGENSSMVTAHLSRSGVLTAFIKTPSEMYYIQPSEHLVSGPHPFQMIAYRRSDVRRSLDPKVMDFIVPPVEDVNTNASDSDAPYFQDPRTARQAISSSVWSAGDSCSLILVADYRFYRQYGANNVAVTTKLVSILDAIDVDIYRPTVWTLDINLQTVSNLGLVIKTIMIHTSYSGSTYNTQEDISDASVLLNKFNTGDGQGKVWDGYCLAHLFTYRVLSNGLLGLSNIASPSATTTGGICSTSFFSSSSGTRIIYNTALSSYTSSSNPLVFVEEVLVTGHEIGHSWGSYHDPATTPSCSNVFIMNQYAQDGSQPTHKMFSSCSRTSIGAVLSAKAQKCFTVRGTGVCGDYVVTSGEQCDAGLLGDTCCTEACQLRSTDVSPAMCSDVNSLCCKGCQVAPKSVVCQQVNALTLDCTTNVTCDGVNTTCPSRLPQAPENTSCVAGICKLKEGRIQCLQYCELRGQQQCFCTGNNSCQLCCQDVGGGACTPYSISTPLGDGVTCPEGSCQRGFCVSTSQDNINKLFAFLNSLDSNTFREFLEVNIVGTVLFFSAVFWCIAGAVIHFVCDTKVNKKIVEELSDIHDVLIKVLGKDTAPTTTTTTPPPLPPPLHDTANTTNH